MWMPRRRPLSFCPCCSAEGNVTELPLLPVRRVTMAAQRSPECRLLPRSLPLCFLTLSYSSSPCLCVIRLSGFPPERFPNTTKILRHLSKMIRNAHKTHRLLDVCCIYELLSIKKIKKIPELVFSKLCKSMLSLKLKFLVIKS